MFIALHVSHIESYNMCITYSDVSMYAITWLVCMYRYIIEALFVLYDCIRDTCRAHTCTTARYRYLIYSHIISYNRSTVCIALYVSHIESYNTYITSRDIYVYHPEALWLQHGTRIVVYRVSESIHRICMMSCRRVQKEFWLPINL